MLMQRLGAGGREEAQLLGVFVERMTGDVETEGLLLVAKFFLLGPFACSGGLQAAVRRAKARRHTTKEAALSPLLLIPGALGAVGDGFERIEQRLPCQAEGIERSRLDQCFDHFL